MSSKLAKYLPHFVFVAYTNLFPTALFAAVSVAEAEALKNGTLTPMGADPKGNEAGTIPAYSGKVLGAPAWVDYKGPGTHYPNMYPNEKPLFVVSSGNYKKYENNLSVGLIAMLNKYPNTFNMPIYTTHRDARYSDIILANTFANATRAKLASNGNGTTDTFGGVPFPIPKNGLEVVFNHQFSPLPYNNWGSYDEAAVQPSGNAIFGNTIRVEYFPVWDPAMTLERFNRDFSRLAALATVTTTEPARQKGEVILVHEYTNYDESSRRAWIYIPGTQRVRRAPSVGYDTPDGVGGLRTVDDHMLFNGATDRFDWKLLGKREVFIPYNNYAMDNPQIKYKQILTPHHVNPQYMRYELHRVWVVEGTVKTGSRHIYAKRVLYLDEDSWAAALADNYDGQGQLWRAAMRTTVNAYDLPGVMGRVAMFHDLTVGAYIVSQLINEQPVTPHIVKEIPAKSYFTPANLRQIGRG